MNFCYSVTTMLSKVTGSWNLKFPKMNFKFVINHGKIMLGNHPVSLILSHNKKFPSSAGWLMFRYMTWVYYIRFEIFFFWIVTFSFDSATSITWLPCENYPFRFTGSASKLFLPFSTYFFHIIILSVIKESFTPRSLITM